MAPLPCPSRVAAAARPVPCKPICSTPSAPRHHRTVTRCRTWWRLRPRPHPLRRKRRLRKPRVSRRRTNRPPLSGNRLRPGRRQRRRCVPRPCPAQRNHRPGRAHRPRRWTRRRLSRQHRRAPDRAHPHPRTPPSASPPRRRPPAARRVRGHRQRHRPPSPLLGLVSPVPAARRPVRPPFRSTRRRWSTRRPSNRARCRARTYRPSHHAARPRNHRHRRHPGEAADVSPSCSLTSRRSMSRQLARILAQRRRKPPPYPSPRSCVPCVHRWRRRPRRQSVPRHGLRSHRPQAGGRASIRGGAWRASTGPSASCCCCGRRGGDCGPPPRASRHSSCW